MEGTWAINSSELATLRGQANKLVHNRTEPRFFNEISTRQPYIPAEHLVHQDTHGPPIHALAMPLALYYLCMGVGASEAHSYMQTKTKTDLF
jgi:hypothetical protein